MITVLIVDDQELMRAGFRMILAAHDDIDVIGEAADGRRGVEMALALEPDVVLMDVRMPQMNGIDATVLLKQQPNPPAVLVLTTFDLDEYVIGALKAGASGFLLKDVSASGLADAIRVIARGDALLAPTATRRLISEFIRHQPVDASRLHDLTQRERDVLREVANGHTNAEIAASLFISEGTVKTHIGRLLDKLDARDRVQLVIIAYQAGHG